jgi:hypothetical protein
MATKPLSITTTEGERLLDPAWRRWGPYISDRQWGTVREDYSPDGEAWSYFPFAHAHLRAYRWGEDGIAGFSDNQQRWCLALAVWNENDSTLKERLFGLTNVQGNHGEDVKEHYVYADATPSHSYNRMLYRYPHAAYPYNQLLTENAKRGKDVPEYEIYDTGVFDNDAFFDITVEYAKASPDDILMRITAHNRGAAAAPLHIVPQFWSRNTWAWSALPRNARISARPDGSLLATRPTMETMRLEIDAADAVLFCENETNVKRLYNEDKPGPFKDGINEAIVHNDPSGLGSNEGSKAAFTRRLVLAPGATATIRLRLRPHETAKTPAFDDFDSIFTKRIQEADAFYAAAGPASADNETRMIQRRAFAGMLWTKQFYHLDIPRWLDGDPAEPKPPTSRTRNSHWRHLNNDDIVSMPDKWEYPWYAAWDLAFHTVVLARIDADFAKNQLLLLTREWYMHPNGQLPAYEWSFGDVNPPVHAYAAWRVYQTDKTLSGKPDTEFLKRVFHKLLLNFTWWVNQKDRDGRNVFQGGFLGLDNVEIFDRSKPLPTGGSIDQADGTAWMAMYSLNMMRISIELAYEDPAYEDMASKFFEHFLAIAGAMTDMGGQGTGLWDEDDGFFYDVLALPDGRHIRLQLRSIVGLIPMFAVEVLDSDVFDRLPAFGARTTWFLKHRPELANLVSRWTEPGKGDQRLLSLLRGHRLTCLLRRMLDPAEFLSPHGVRSLSKIYARPYVLDIDGQHFQIGYEPAEAQGAYYGGNSNWRGPVWFPINYMLVDSLRSFHTYYGDDFRVECPVGSGTLLSLNEVADFLSHRLTTLFRIGPDGKRPFCSNRPGECGASDELMFNEYFHGETGKGLGASHQTGWTGLVACLLGEAN